MKTTTLARIYALAISTLFATIATVGVATMMASSGEHARTAFGAATSVQNNGQDQGAAFTRWDAAPATGTRQQL